MGEGKRQFLILASVLSALTCAGVTLAKISGYRAFQDTRNGFAISFPTEGWDEVSPSDARFQGVAAQFGRPASIVAALASRDPESLASIVITAEAGRINLPLTQTGLGEGVQRLNARMSPQGRIDSATFVKLDGYNAVKLLIRVNMTGSKEHDQTQWQYIVPAGEKALHILLTAKTTHFQGYEPTFATAVGSFRLTSGTKWIKWGSGTVFDGVLDYAVLGGVLFGVVGAVAALGKRLTGKRQ